MSFFSWLLSFFLLPLSTSGCPQDQWKHRDTGQTRLGKVRGFVIGNQENQEIAPIDLDRKFYLKLTFTNKHAHGSADILVHMN